eukprot:3000410-Amphidinium_carterae.1
MHVATDGGRDCSNQGKAEEADFDVELEPLMSRVRWVMGALPPLRWRSWLMRVGAMGPQGWR